MPRKQMRTYQDYVDKVKADIAAHSVFEPGAPVVCMVSGGSDSTALAYIMKTLAGEGIIGTLAFMHLNHNLRGEDSDGDAEFVRRLSSILDVPLYDYSVDIQKVMEDTKNTNMEDVARTQRYRKVREALTDMCRGDHDLIGRACIATAHTRDDRVETFYMRSIVGTGPGGFRSIKWTNMDISRPFLDLSKEDLRNIIYARKEEGLPVVEMYGELWREDMTNHDSDHFRSFVRNQLVPVAKEWNGDFSAALSRSMELIADEDDMLSQMADDAVQKHIVWKNDHDLSRGFDIAPGFGTVPRPLARRAIFSVLNEIAGTRRIENASVEKILNAFDNTTKMPISGYKENVQFDLILSANKRGVHIEALDDYIARTNPRKPALLNRE